MQGALSFREKDRAFVRTLLIEEMILAKILIERINLLKIDEGVRERLLKWIQNTIEEM